MKLLAQAVVRLLLVSSASAFHVVKPVLPPLRGDGAVQAALELQRHAHHTGNATFQQFIDHANPSLGTFSQHFWWATQYYAGPGSPVVFICPGESAGDDALALLTNKWLPGIVAQAVGGAIVMIEHRYYGESSPYTVLSTANLTHLTLANSIADFTNFANHVSLPFDVKGTSHPQRAPWIFIGGSYGGALSAWTAAKDPSTFWIYQVSSAVVETIHDFWRYMVPIQQGMPKNCSTDINLVIDHVDHELQTASPADKKALKAQFGLQDLEHDDDFTHVLLLALWAWQDVDFAWGDEPFRDMCDYVENVRPGNDTSHPLPGATGVGLKKALSGFARYIKEELVPGYCASYGYTDFQGDLNVNCFNSYNVSSPLYHDLDVVNNADRQFFWFYCNEPFEWWRGGAPHNVPSVISRLLTPAYWIRKCSMMFPPTEGSTAVQVGVAAGKTAADVNAYTGGWNYINTTRLLWVNGEFDPWRGATVSADVRPGGPLASTPEQPVFVIPGGFHCSDWDPHNGKVNAGVRAVQNAEIRLIRGWVKDFYTEHKIERNFDYGDERDEQARS